MDFGCSTGGVHVFVGDGGGVDAEEQVVADRALEEGGFLGDEGDVLAVGCHFEGGNGGSVEEDLAGLKLIESGRKVDCVSCA